MSGSVPLITDPRNQLLGTLPFACARASNQCHNAVRRLFDDNTSERTNVTVMLHLVTRNGPTLMEMIANLVRNEGDDRQREVRVMLIGREVDPSLAGLLRHCNNDASATESDVTLSETNHDEDHYRSVSEKGSFKSDDAGAMGIFHEVPSDARAHDEDRQNVYEDPTERIACAALARVRRLGDVVCTSWDTCSGLLASSARRGRIPELESCMACLPCLEQQQAQAHFCVPVPGPCSPKCMGCVVKCR